MTKKIVNEYYPDSVSPPGATLQEALEERGIAYDDFATQIGLAHSYLIALFDGQADLTPLIAESLEKTLGIPVRFWLAREKDYQEYLERQRNIA